MASAQTQPRSSSVGRVRRLSSRADSLVTESAGGVNGGLAGLRWRIRPAWRAWPARFGPVDDARPRAMAMVAAGRCPPSAQARRWISASTATGSSLGWAAMMCGHPSGPMISSVRVRSMTSARASWLMRDIRTYSPPTCSVSVRLVQGVATECGIPRDAETRSYGGSSVMVMTNRSGNAVCRCARWPGRDLPLRRSSARSRDTSVPEARAFTDPGWNASHGLLVAVDVPTTEGRSTVMHPLPPPTRSPRRWPYIAGSAVVAAIAVATMSVVLLHSSDEPANAAGQDANSPIPAPTTTTPPTTQAPTTTPPPTTATPTTAAPITAAPTTAAPLPPVIIQQQPPVIIQQQPPVVIHQAPPVHDPNLVPPGTIEDGTHYGYLTDVEGMYQFTFDRADVQDDGSWSNTNRSCARFPQTPRCGDSPTSTPARRSRWSSRTSASSGSTPLEQQPTWRNLECDRMARIGPSPPPSTSTARRRRRDRRGRLHIVSRNRRQHEPRPDASGRIIAVGE